MSVGKRLRRLREEKGLSQADVEKASGLLRSYVSRVEHGHTVPSLGALEKFAKALDIPLYQLFCEGEGVPPERKPVRETVNGKKGKMSHDARLVFGTLAKAFSKL